MIIQKIYQIEYCIICYEQSIVVTSCDYQYCKICLINLNIINITKCSYYK